MSHRPDPAPAAPTGRARLSVAAALVVAALAASVLPAVAIDPLPPELERASLAEQSAWRERMGRESKTERDQMARKRHEERLVYKTGLAANFRLEASSVLDAARHPTTQPSSIEETWAETSGKFRWIAIIAGILGVGFVTRRVLSPAAE